MQATLERLRQRRDERADEGGFTLIELLIVIVILAILAAIIVFAVQNLTGTSAKASCESDVQTVDHAVQAYDAQMGKAPTSIATMLTAAPAGTGVNGDTPGPWLHNTPTNGNHYAVIVSDGTTVVSGFNESTTGDKTTSKALSAGTIIVQAPVGTASEVYDPSGAIQNAATTVSAACVGVTS